MFLTLELVVLYSSAPEEEGGREEGKRGRRQESEAVGKNCNVNYLAQQWEEGEVPV